MRYGFETDTARAFPRYLMYDVNNLCNARCSFCPQSALSREDDFEPRQIEWAHFEKTIEEAAQYPVELVRFTGDGEPLLHPRMTDMVARARALGLQKINLTTNGSLLRDRRLDKLLESPPHVLDVSLDAFTPETYAKYRIGLDFDTTMRNVHEFLRMRDPTVTRVIVSMIHHPELNAEVAAFREYWTPRADLVAVRRLHSNLGAVDVPQTTLPPERWPCTHLWQRLVVDFRGHIRFCPIDWHDQSFVAHVDSMTLSEAWHGVMLETLRRRHLENDYRGCGVCEKCTDWANTPWSEGWVDMMKQSSLQFAAGPATA